MKKYLYMFLLFTMKQSPYMNSHDRVHTHIHTHTLIMSLRSTLSKSGKHCREHIGEMWPLAWLHICWSSGLFGACRYVNRLPTSAPPISRCPSHSSFASTFSSVKWETLDDAAVLTEQAHVHRLSAVSDTELAQLLWASLGREIVCLLPKGEKSMPALS